MTDPDERVSSRYRELAREEPPPLLDQAILASARRAVAPRAGNRWAIPVSIAAVLFLGVGVSLRMQSEKPGIESSVPAGGGEYPVPRAEEPAVGSAPAARPAPATPPPSPPRLQAEGQSAPAPRDSAAAPAPRPLKKDAALARRDPKPFADAPASIPFQEPPVLAAQAPVPAAPPAALARPSAPAPEAPPGAKLAAPTIVTPDSSPSQPARPPQNATITSAASASPSAATSAPASAAAPARQARAVAQDNAAAGVAEMRAKREAPRAEALSVHEAPVPRDLRMVELERIAKLRAEGRHDEADKALEDLRRKHPDFRIPEATWEKVKPR